MKTGLFFGSFNPVHIGHMAIANYFVEFTDIDELWFVVSPHNPLKDKTNLLDCQARLELLQLAIKDDKRFLASDIEFDLPQPSYTVDTLEKLKRLFPDNEFVIVMGSDGLPTFNKWKNYQEITRNYQRYVYPRGTENKTTETANENIRLVNAPRLDISSTFLRESIAQGRDIRHFLPDGVFKLILDKAYYT